MNCCIFFLQQWKDHLNNQGEPQNVVSLASVPHSLSSMLRLSNHQMVSSDLLGPSRPPVGAVIQFDGDSPLRDSLDGGGQGPPMVRPRVVYFPNGQVNLRATMSQLSFLLEMTDIYQITQPKYDQLMEDICSVVHEVNIDGTITRMLEEQHEATRHFTERIGEIIKATHDLSIIPPEIILVSDISEADNMTMVENVDTYHSIQTTDKG